MSPCRIVQFVVTGVVLVAVAANPIKSPPVVATTTNVVTNAGGKPSQTAKSSGIQPVPSTARFCTVAGKKFTAMSYIIGSPAEPGSVFAVCTNGISKCFKDDGRADVIEREELPCASVKLPTNASVRVRSKARQLGLYHEARRMWPQGKVCYSLQQDIAFTANELQDFNAAIQEFRDVPNTDLDIITLQQCRQLYKKEGATTPICDDCRQSVQIQDRDPGCWAHVGYYPSNAQVLRMNLGEGCRIQRTMIHEFGHVFGLFHEHQHPNREVVVLRQHVALAQDQFMELGGIHANYRVEQNFARLTEYDIHSIMHYDWSIRAPMLCLPIFANPPNSRWCDIFETAENNCVVPTIDDCRPEQPERFGGDVLSAGDKATLLLMYPTVGTDPGDLRR